ncbi:hypothetical protein BRM9_0466 [Methanobacterium formicicum]|uniref:Glycosyltransferase RgtA/B/C/D-like domain-containing protein n=1 Tax=Methanobacterium formicicum TaxID=2162 RepID=A0A089Z8Z0_METFO|nr:glycosyltransferase family 39 protein [Methanobacterium formicicum]AIS31291.1 hypothetical protein BRM9_0466 [Methanobacterium formicicum]
MDLGPIFDTYDYLANAAEFAGKGIDFSDFTRPPIISILTAIFFVFGKLSVGPIMIVDGLLYILGCIGLYLFLKTFFDPLISFIGSLLFATFPIVIAYAGAGFNDVSSVAVAIWAIYLTYLAVKKDSKYFYLSFPLALVAFLTRYNMALIIFPVVLFILINWKEIEKPRNIVIGLGLSVLLLIPLLFFFNLKFGNSIAPFLSFFKTSGGSGVTEHFAYNPDPLYFLKNILSYVGAASMMMALFTLLGLVVVYFRKRKISSKNNSGMFNKNLFKDYKFITIMILLFVFLVSFAKVHYMISEFIFFIICYVAYLIAADYSIDADTDLLFLAWFMVFFIFQSVYVAKDHRYFITMAAPLVYFLIRGFSWSVRELKVKFKGVNVSLFLLTILLVSMMLFSVASQIPDIEKDNQNSKLFNQDAQTASYWLMNYDPDYKSKIIYADLWSYFGWFLQSDVGKMPVFRNNETIYAGTKDYNFTEDDKMAFDRELNKTNPDYYFGVWGMNFTNYEPINRFGQVTIYKRK